MEITLFNTLTGKKDLFKPIIPGNIGMYNCGPTVYNYAHIGNLRAYVFTDILRRMFEFNDYKVKQVMNITDVGHLTSDADTGEDKMTKALTREGKPITLEAMKEIADFYTERFMEDISALNVDTTRITFPRASEYITEQIELIQKIEEKGMIYKTSDGIYFNVALFPEYGKLGNIKNNESENEQSRIGINPEKKDPRDFALWKFDTKLGWESPWGKGFPGWSIECSAMALKLLGDTFDIHTGGIDHIPTHHNNEIAQSESVTSKPFAHYWLHNAHLIIEGGKMAKSAGNFVTMKTLAEQNVSALSYRYWLLTAHYRTQVNFTWEAVGAAQTALFKLYKHFSEFGGLTPKKTDAAYADKFTMFINDDLDTPKAIALVWELIKDKKVVDEDKKATLIEFDRVLGLGLSTFIPEIEITEVPAEIQVLADAREEARKEKDFTKADALRKEIESRGYELKDTEGGVRIVQR